MRKNKPAKKGRRNSADMLEGKVTELSERDLEKVVGGTKRLDKASTKLFMDAVAGDLSTTLKF
jgi:hypothetical protein